MGLREGLSQDVECVSRTSVNWLLEPGSANNLNESRYACSNLIERSASGGKDLYEMRPFETNRTGVNK